MAIDQAEYVPIDPLSTGPHAVARAFENQVAYCRSSGAPITASVCQAIRELLGSEGGGVVMERIRKWAGPPLADALPLRLAGGIHALHLTGEEPALRPIYDGLAPRDANARVADAIERHEAFLLPWLDGPPQTNEAGRSWGFAAAMLWLVDKGFPNDFALYEVGSSAGINLMMDRYAYNLGGVAVGPADAAIRLEPEWRGEPPPAGDYRIEEIRGCDVSPVDLSDPDQALRLKAFIWPEFTARFERMDRAIAAAGVNPPDLVRMGAADFLDEVLDEDARPGLARIVMHSVVWQYIPEHERGRIKALMEAAGAAATDENPLAWVTLEANRDTHRHELWVRYWPGGEEWQKLGTAHPHGNWVSWTG